MPRIHLFLIILCFLILCYWIQISFSSNNNNPLKPYLNVKDDRTRHFIGIGLRKDPKLGFGFNIVGGIDETHIPGHTGIFISHVRPEGPAFKDGRLRPGDRIVAVDDILLSSKTHSEAVEIFRQSNGKIRLWIEQGAETRILHHPSAILPTLHQFKNDIENLF